MEHISERILLWLLTHANARTKFRSVIRHQAIFWGQSHRTNQMPRGGTRLAYFCASVCISHSRFSPEGEKDTHCLRNISRWPSWGSGKQSGSKAWQVCQRMLLVRILFLSMGKCWVRRPGSEGRDESKAGIIRQLSLLQWLIRGQSANANSGFPCCNLFL